MAEITVRWNFFGRAEIFVYNMFDKVGPCCQIIEVRLCKKPARIMTGGLIGEAFGINCPYLYLN